MFLGVKMQVECGQLLAGKGAGGAAESLVPPVVVPQVSRQPLPIPQIRETVAAAGLRVGGVQLQVGAKRLPVRTKVGPAQRTFKPKIKHKFLMVMKTVLRSRSRWR